MRKLWCTVLIPVMIFTSCMTGNSAVVSGMPLPASENVAEAMEHPVSDELEQVNSLIRLTMKENPGKIIISLIGGENTRRFTFDNPRSNVLTFSTSFLGFDPEDIKVFSWGGIAEVEFTVEKIPVYSDGKPPVEPLPADFREIIYSGTDGWRYSDYEIYRWESFPEIIVFDILNYDIQSSMLKRLSFFVEKKGFAGEIHSFAELSGKSDWNAHNYLAKDLAAFFTLAEEKGIHLTSGEKNLRSALVAAGIIEPAKGGSGYTGIKNGGILSVSQESRVYLRSLLLNHEGYHGLFYAVPELRDLVFDAWEKLIPEAREMWLDYLRTSVYWNYDYENQYLLKNEMLGYLMQQQDFGRYYDGTMFPRVLKQCSEKADYYVEKSDAVRESFMSMAGTIDEFLGTNYNLEAGNLSYLRELK